MIFNLFVHATQISNIRPIHFDDEQKYIIIEGKYHTEAKSSMEWIRMASN